MTTLEAIVNLSRRRGFAFPSSEIYGGLRSAYDYGPLGVEMLRNVKNEWWRSMVQARRDVVGIDSAVIQSRRVWQASGHEEVFTDPLVECRKCQKRFRQDHLTHPDRCPSCGNRDTLTEPRHFNLMLRTHMGPVETEENLVYLRPETAQGIFINFVNVQRVSRRKLPFGIAQIGKSFRNEITPGQFVFRTREFEQMEMEWFCLPSEASEWFEYWVDVRRRWYLDLGMNPQNLRIRPHGADELSHYSQETVDVDYRFSWGWDELEGIANRTDFDLRRHSEHSGQDLSYFDQAAGTRVIPWVIEPAAGATRTTFAFLADAYRTEEVRGSQRVVLGLHPRLAPYKVAVLPLSRKPRLVEPAARIADDLSRRWTVEFDVTQSIGRRYRRQDEIGTPLCVTFDFDSTEDGAVTVRDRDTMRQVRVGTDRLAAYLGERLGI